MPKQLITIVAVLLLSACAGSSTEPSTTPPTQETEEPASQDPEPPGPPGPPAAERPALSAADCEASGGQVVGDIGDGAIHRPDYRCPSGAEPTGTITVDPEGPVNTEGAVCCP